MQSWGKKPLEKKKSLTWCYIRCILCSKHHADGGGNFTAGCVIHMWCFTQNCSTRGIFTPQYEESYHQPPCRPLLGILPPTSMQTSHIIGLLNNSLQHPMVLKMHVCMCVCSCALPTVKRHGYECSSFYIILYIMMLVGECDLLLWVVSKCASPMGKQQCWSTHPQAKM